MYVKEKVSFLFGVLSMNFETALCWFADSPLGQEIIINGARRGIGAKHRGLEKYRYASKTDIFQ